MADQLQKTECGGITQYVTKIHPQNLLPTSRQQHSVKIQYFSYLSCLIAIYTVFTHSFQAIRSSMFILWVLVPTTQDGNYPKDLRQINSTGHGRFFKEKLIIFAKERACFE